MTFLAAAEPHTSMRDRIADTIRNAILNGELVPGQRITETEIAAQLGTSRAPVREAIRELVNEGFLQSHAYRETRVSSITTRELKEVLVPIRIVAESFALRELMARPNADAVLDELHDYVEAMREAIEANDPKRVREEDLAFHRALVESSEYQHPARVWSSITPVVYRAFVLGTTEETMRETVEGHARLLAAVKQGDAELAETMLVEHIEEMTLRFHEEGEDESHEESEDESEAR